MHMKDLVMKRPQTDILHQHIIVTPAPHLLSVATTVANRGNHNYCKIIQTAPIFIVSVNTAHASVLATTPFNNTPTTSNIINS